MRDAKNQFKITAACPKFEVDPWFPKPLPERWVTGQLSTVCVDGHDHMIVTNRRDLSAEVMETSANAPSVIMFDLAGNVVEAWGTSGNCSRDHP